MHLLQNSVFTLPPRVLLSGTFKSVIPFTHINGRWNGTAELNDIRDPEPLEHNGVYIRPSSVQRRLASPRTKYSEVMIVMADWRMLCKI